MNEITDKERLDWLESQRFWQITSNSSAWPEHMVISTNQMDGTGPSFHHAETLREAIDKAMTAQREH